jgi:gliding motility-associated-like protein
MKFYLNLFAFLLFANFSKLAAQSLLLTTSPQWVDIGDLDVAGNQLTVEALVYKTGGVNVLSKHTNPADVNYLLRMATFELTTTTGFHFMTNPYVMNNNQWYHIAGTYDGATIKYYVNGCLVISQAATGNLVTQNLITAIGNISCCSNEQFYGNIDELRVWNIARSQAQIQANMNNLPSPTTQLGLLAYYQFTNNLLNAQGNATFNGIAQGAAVVYAPEPPLIITPSITSIVTQNELCIVGTGTAGINAIGTSLQYSIDGITFSSSPSYLGLSAGNFTATIKSIEGCILQQPFTITTTPTPTLSVVGNTAICSSQTTSLTVSGATTYTWSTFSNSATINVSPASTITYTVVGSTVPTCIGFTVVSVSVTPTPTLSVSPSNSICAGNTSTLVVTGATNYTWSPGASLSSVSSTTVIASPTISTIYSVIGANGTCSVSATTSVNVVANPVINIIPNVTGVCLGNNINLVASGGTTYTWSTEPSLNTTIGTTVIATPTVLTSYTVTGSVGSCTSNAVASVSISPNPTLSAVASSTAICIGNTTTLTVSGAATYTWSPALTLSSSSGSLVIASPSLSTTYSVSGENATGCITNTIITISVSPNPTITITPSVSTICIGNSKSLSATGATTYSWSSSPSLSTLSGPVVVATPSITTTYTVTGSVGICSSSITAIVNVAPLPIILIVASPSAICSTKSSTLSASGAVTYTWSPALSLSISTGSITVATPYTTTTFSVMGTDGLGCVSNSTVLINVTPTPTIVLSVSNFTICEGTSTNLQINGASNYLWSPSASLSSSIDSNVVASPVVTTLYTVIGNNGICTDSKNVTINVIPKIIPLISPNDTSICFGNSIKLVASGGNKYLWSPSGSLSSATSPYVIAKPLVTTIYTVSVSNNNICPQTKSIQIIVNQLPFVYAGIDSTINIDQNITLIGSGDGVFGYKSLDGEQLLCNYCSEITVAPKQNTCYLLHSINSFGCENTDEVCVSVTKDYGIFIPNAFTPNGDSDNELFLPVGFGIESYNITMYDKWGNPVFKSSEEHKAWDGKVKGKPAEQDVYVYRIVIKTMGNLDIVKVGHVTLLGKLK